MQVSAVLLLGMVLGLLQQGMHAERACASCAWYACTDARSCSYLSSTAATCAPCAAARSASALRSLRACAVTYGQSRHACTDTS